MTLYWYVTLVYIHMVYFIFIYRHIIISTSKNLHPRKSPEKSCTSTFPHSFLRNWAEPTGNFLLVSVSSNPRVEPQSQTAAGWWEELWKGFLEKYVRPWGRTRWRGGVFCQRFLPKTRPAVTIDPIFLMKKGYIRACPHTFISTFLSRFELEDI